MAKEFEQSRFDDEYVRREFRTVRLTGKKGSGYLFDTNSIHKGTPEGSLHRDVIVVEPLASFYSMPSTAIACYSLWRGIIKPRSVGSSLSFALICRAPVVTRDR